MVTNAWHDGNDELRGAHARGRADGGTCGALERCEMHARGNQELGSRQRAAYLIIEQGVHPQHVAAGGAGDVASGGEVQLFAPAVLPAVQREADDRAFGARRFLGDVNVRHLCESHPHISCTFRTYCGIRYLSSCD